MIDGAQSRLDRHMEMRRGSPAGTDPTTGGVTVAWLATAFEMSPEAVRSKLRHCPVKMRRQRGSSVELRYDLKEAARYLVTPAFGTADYLRATKKSELPPALQQTVWDALLKRQKWEENAGDLWRTAKVREVLRAAFQNMKFTIQLWADTVERQVELTQPQRDLIVEMADGLQAELYHHLVEGLSQQNTGSQLDEMADLVGESRTVKSIVARVEDPDDEIEELV